MVEGLDEHDDDALGAESPDEDTRTPDTLLTRLRERREAIRAERVLYLEVPGYNNELVVCYKPIEWGELKKIGEKANKSKHPERELIAMADTLIRACDSVHIRVDGALRPFDPDGQGYPCKFDERLAEALGIENADSARKVLFATFNNDLAITAQHNEVGQWMQDSDDSREDDESFVGES